MTEMLPSERSTFRVATATSSDATNSLSATSFQHSLPSLVLNLWEHFVWESEEGEEKLSKCLIRPTRMEWKPPKKKRPF